MKRPGSIVRVALPVGDPNGIGPEIALRTVEAWRDHPGLELTLFGPAIALERTAQKLGLTPLLERTATVPTPGFPETAFAPGRICAEAGRATMAAASAAIEATGQGRHDVIVAAPHHETAIRQAGIDFSGYPSLVASVRGAPPSSVFLLLIGGGLRIVHATLHESLRSGLDRLDSELIVNAALAGQRALLRLGIPAPRIAVFGINPHAGEDGLFGNEDEAITRPAVARLRELGLDVTGPAGADTLLAEDAHDLYVANYHDQGHIPVKVRSPRQASALSVGGDVILSSVGHGSAMDIAGRGIASPEAMIRTVALLAHCPVPASTR